MIRKFTRVKNEMEITKILSAEDNELITWGLEVLWNAL